MQYHENAVNHLCFRKYNITYGSVSSLRQAEEFKAQGNKAFSSGEFQNAIAFFGQAIALDASNHVLYSNRSAAHASLKDYEAALVDAEKTVSIKPDWAKGYSRKGAALYGLGELPEASDAYNAGLKLEPGNALLKKGLEDVEKAMSSDLSNPMAAMFGPDMWTKLASNPKLSPFLAQPDVVEMLQQCQKDPSSMSKYMQDQRMMQIMLGLMGLDGAMASNAEDLEKAKEKASDDIDKRREEQSRYVPPSPVVPEVSPEQQKRQQSDKLKADGNDLYKKRKFEEALNVYDQAFSADETNVAVLTNKAAVLFEMENYTDAIKACEIAVETGREIRADFKLIGRALGRIGSAYFKLEDYDNAIRHFNKSLAENRTADILTKLRETEAIKASREKQAYLDPVISEAEREKGNVFFKGNQYPEAVKCYSEAIKRNPTDAKNYSNRAAAYTKLLALPEAERDCDEAIRLDEGFVKAYIRKAAVQFGKREYSKCVETCNLALIKDSDNKHQGEIQGQISKAYNALSTARNSDEGRKEAMNNPEVQKILSDPVMNQILQQMQSDPAAIKDHMKNPIIMKQLQVLIDAGIVSMGSR